MNIALKKIHGEDASYELVLLKTPKTARQALQDAIDKWTVIAAVEGSGVQLTIDHITTCGLCRRYLDKNCMSCPVKQRTGKPFCKGTPYMRYDRYPNRAAALAERALLQSLKPGR